MNARLIREEERDATPGEKTKDTLGDAEKRKDEEAGRIYLDLEHPGGQRRSCVSSIARNIQPISALICNE